MGWGERFFFSLLLLRICEEGRFGAGLVAKVGGCWGLRTEPQHEGERRASTVLALLDFGSFARRQL